MTSSGQIEVLGILIPVQEYREIRAKYMETKTQQRALHEKVARLKEKNAPLHTQLKYIFITLCFVIG